MDIYSQYICNAVSVFTVHRAGEQSLSITETSNSQMSKHT